MKGTKKTEFAPMITLVIIALLGVATYVGWKQVGSPGQSVFPRTEVKEETAVPAEDIIQALPKTRPFQIPLYPGVTESSVYIDTTSSNNYFYSVDAPMADVVAFFEGALDNARKHLNGDISATFDDERNGYRSNVFISTVKPTIYPPEFTEGNTFVSVTYNLPPLKVPE